MNRDKEDCLKEIGSILIESKDSYEMKKRIGEPLLKLLDADYFVSCIWNEDEQSFEDSVFLNMPSKSLELYEAYYQYHDPITYLLQKKRDVTRVKDVMSYKNLRKTEFYNDFLKKDGLYFGMNYYSNDREGRNIGDLRIWKSSCRKDFTNEDVRYLSIVADWFDSGLQRVRKNKLKEKTLSHPKLTRREKEVCQLILSGLTNKEVGCELCISSETVKTHLKNIYSKLNVHHRMGIAKELSFFG